MEPVCPIVVGNLAVVFLDCDDESDQDLVIKSLQTKRIHKHVQGLFNLDQVAHVQGVEFEADGLEQLRD